MKFILILLECVLLAGAALGAMLLLAIVIIVVIGAFEARKGKRK